jgi:hypothetical protein
MNERIKDLAREAGYYLYDLTETHEIKTVETDSTDEWITLEKFAELIVQECARIARATPCPYTDEPTKQRLGHTWDMACADAGREIVNHFGVNSNVE